MTENKNMELTKEDVEKIFREAFEVVKPVIEQGRAAERVTGELMNMYFK